MTPLIPQRGSANIDQRALSQFGIGVGVHLDTDVDSTPSDPSTIAFLRELGVTRYRLNVRWKTIAPRSDGAINAEALDHLAATAEQLLEAGIEPLVALDNSALPVDVEADGGWLNLATARAYGDFVGAVGARMGDLADQWITVATARPPAFQPSMMPVLVAAQIDASNIVRAHAPHASLGASIDTSQFDSSLPPAEVEATQEWLAHLASPAAATDFVSINGDQAAARPPTVIGQLIRALDHNMPGRSFMLTEARSINGARGSQQPDDGTGSDRYSVGFELVDQIRQLRTDQIDVSDAFAWPFSDATACRAGLTDAAIERCRRIVSAGIE